MQFIGQLPGLDELHALFLVNFATLIFYRDWRLLVLPAIFAFFYHDFLLYLRLRGHQGAGDYFGGVPVTLTTLGFRCGLVTFMGVVSG